MSWVIDMALLPLLLLAEGYLMGSLFARGWVTDIEAPSRWGWYHALSSAWQINKGAVVVTMNA